MPGDARVGPYRILRLINRGGQGSVYLGYDKRLQRRVAIKIYPLPSNRVARKQLLLEAQLVASMQSPKVVQIHDVIGSREHLAMVMEYVPGCDLEQFLQSVRPSLASILAITADIAGALTIARQQRIVHGDLKAGNVLIATSGRVKLTDFGIAHHPTDGELSGGSRSCVSPEQYRGEPVDERSDLFALGCLLYRMLAGAHPFVREGRLDGRALVEGDPIALQERVSADVELPPALVALVTALLQKNPAHRPSSTRVVRQILRRVARDLPLAAANSLLTEARPCFRAESAEDIPPAVPPDLGREGRSTLLRASGDGFRPWPLVNPRGWVLLAAGLAAAIGVVSFILHAPTQAPVYVDAPIMRLAANAELPLEISSRWLVTEVTEAMRERLGSEMVTSPISPSQSMTLYADPTLRESLASEAEQLQLKLRCIDLMCVFAVSRNWQGRQSNQQAVLFPDMSSQQWRDIVRTTTLALYP